ncbi:hypothetical protein B5G11_12470 [Drancourtella sp. An57]|uniref:hypothetical protein n=1 Tax=Drancourtella sp. An57 TaxID=1965647 RepID=UPI000B3752F5|nr:hypothetical protein [Drancourtella sp. An57]OUN68574.1 hypothetical protein B5G11_12470 [Drancourtella sp. An57]
MDYVQMTLDDWMEMKRKLRQELLGVKQSFVRIGYALRQIEDQKLYERDGYKSIAEFAKEEYGLEPSTTSRFMSINKEYSIDGYSEQLRPEFAELGRSQLEEMLKLPDNDRSMIQPETSRENIRELKRFNKTEPAAGVADDLSQLVEKFYYDNPDILNAVFGEPEFTEETIKQFAEIVNPGGNRSYKKGLYFLMMYENRVAVKKFNTDPKNLTWWEFWELTKSIFGNVAAGSKTWQSYFGEPEEPEPENEVAPAQKEAEFPGKEEPKDTKEENKEEKQREEEPEEMEAESQEPPEEPDVPEKPESEIAPAQREEEIPEREVENETCEETDRGADPGETGEPEAAEEEKEEETESSPAVMNRPEILDKPFGSRKDWFDTLTPYGMALELAKKMRDVPNENLADMKKTGFWEEWLKEEVDDYGRTIEED